MENHHGGRGGGARKFKHRRGNMSSHVWDGQRDQGARRGQSELKLFYCPSMVLCKVTWGEQGVRGFTPWGSDMSTLLKVGQLAHLALCGSHLLLHADADDHHCSAGQRCRQKCGEWEPHGCRTIRPGTAGRHCSTMSPWMIQTRDIGSGDWVSCADSINKVVHVIGKVPYQWQSFFCPLCL
jgi:hypothetical protein